jgi:hypothetical protein
VHVSMWFCFWSPGAAEEWRISNPSGDKMTLRVGEVDAVAVIGTCNSVGAISSICDGGIGSLMGHYGAAANNIVSARIVGPSGIAQTVSGEPAPDLFWALRGAGHNFGIVTSLTVKAHPQLNGGQHYAGMLIVPPARLEAVVDATAVLDVTPDKGLNVLFLRAPPAFDPVVAASAREAYAGPVRAGSRPPSWAALLPYTRLNKGLDRLCFTGSSMVCY